MLKLILASAISAFMMSIPHPHEGDRIPDFSRVGYRWGDKPIPTVKVVKTLKAPAGGADATDLIQNAIDNMSAPGAILLKAGVYNIDGPINIFRSGVVLRGEGDATVLVCTGTRQRSLITIGEKFKREVDHRTGSVVADEYTPFGADYVRVAKPERFKEGQNVTVFRPSTAEWLHDIRMDQIPQFFDTYGIITRQWMPGERDFYYDRVISRIEGDKLYLDNPMVYALDAKYGGGKVFSYTSNRISECGVENLTIVSEFDESITQKVRGEQIYADEQHGWTAITFFAAEHCWVRNVTAKHFGYALARCTIGAKHITVKDCMSCEPVSKIHGSRRYGYCIDGGQCCLFINCNGDHDRHGFVLNGTTCGPNVYTGGRLTNMYSDIGPHNRFATGGLYDNLFTDGSADVQDRAGSGHGHGWAGANMIFWNCEAKNFAVQGLWASSTNYAIGCIGEKVPGWFGQGSKEQYKKTGRKPVGEIPMDYEERPDGVWISQGKHVEPASLYLYQLEQRQKAGVTAVPAKCLKSDKSK